MTPAREHALCLADPIAWARHVAPRWLQMLARATPDEQRRIVAMVRPELRRAICERALCHVDRCHSRRSAA